MFAKDDRCAAQYTNPRLYQNIVLDEFYVPRKQLSGNATLLLRSVASLVW